MSISANETKTDQGDNMITVVYRKKSLSNDAVPFDSLQAHQFDKNLQWESLGQAAQEFCNGHHLVALTHTPKSVMNQKSQVAWYSNEGARSDYSFHYIKCHNGDWDALVKKAHSWLNRFVAPHQLVHVSMHEGSHPNKSEDQPVYCVITHTAGENPTELKNIPNAHIPAAGLYSKSVHRGNEEFSQYFD